MMVDEEKLKKLPKWAQREFETLRRQLREAQAALRAEHEDHPHSRVAVVVDIDEVYHLPDDAQIRFYLGGYDQRRGYLDVRIDDSHPRRGPHLELLGGNTLTVIPWSTNLIRVRAEDL